MATPTVQKDYQTLKEIFFAALEVDPPNREAFLNERCTDMATRAEIESLLSSRHDAGNFLEDISAVESIQNSYQKAAVRDMVGQLIGSYRLEREIGRGGMGIVFLATRETFHQKVALKIIKRGMDSDAIVQKFFRERQIMAALNHPFIANLLDGGTTENGSPYFVMEYVEGLAITDYASRENLGLEERLNLFCEVAAAVSFAHQNLIIHSDLKPTNILVSKKGIPKLLDFGIARFVRTDTNSAETVTQSYLFTPQYASPEQVRGQKLTTATDIYSLGLILYELLTGRRPYRSNGHSMDDVLRAVCETEPPRPSSAISTEKESRRKVVEEKVRPYGQCTSSSPLLPFSSSQLKGDIDNIVLKAIRKDPLRRYFSVEQLTDDLRRHLAGRPVAASADSWGYRASKFIRRNRVWAGAAAVIFLTLVGGIVATAWEAHAARLQSARADQRFTQVRELAHSVLFEYHDAAASLPGSTPLREKLVADALKYMDELSKDEDADASLRRELADAYLKVADVQGRPYASNLGQTEAALSSYNKAMTMLGQLAENDPADRELTRDLATVYERIGNIEMRKANWSIALSNNKRAFTMRQDLLLLDPTNKDFQSDLADSYLYVGDALQATCAEGECLAEALKYQRLSLEIRQTLARDDPSNPQIRRSIAQAYTRIGFRLAAMGQLAKDREYLEAWLENDLESLRIRRELAAENPTNAIDRRNLADQLMLTADAQQQNKNVLGAFRNYLQSLDIFRALSMTDPDNSEAKRDLSFVYSKLADAYLASGKVAKARESYGESLKFVEQLTVSDPTSMEDLQSAAHVYAQFSQLSEKEGHIAQTVENWRKVAQLREQMVAINPDNVQQRTSMAEAYVRMAIFSARMAGARTMGAHVGFLDANSIPSVDSLRFAELRKAREWFQKGLEVYRELEKEGQIGAYSYRLPQIEGEIAKCDAVSGKDRSN